MCGALAFSFPVPLRAYRPRAVRQSATHTAKCSAKPPDEPPSSSDDLSKDRTWTVLQERVSQLREKEIAADRRLANNWRTGKYKTSVVASVSDDYVRKVSFQGDYLACGTTMGNLVFSDLVSGKRLQCSNIHVGQITALHYAYSFIASAGANDFSVAVWKCADFECAAFWTSLSELQGDLPQPFLLLENEHTDIVTQVIIDAPENRLYTSSIDGFIRVFNLETGKIEYSLQVGGPIFSMILTEKKYILAGCASGHVQAYQAERGVFLLSIPCHSKNTTALDFFEENQTLVTGDSSGNIRVWSFRDSTCVGEVLGHEAAVMSLQVDCSKIVSAGRDGRINVAMLNDLEHLYTISGFTKYLSKVCFDNTRLISDGKNDVIMCHRFDIGKDGDD